MEPARRVVGRPFQKGDDPRRNRAGPRALPITQALAKKLTNKDADSIADVVIAQAMEGNPWAVQFLADRLEGKAIARNENGEPGDFDVTLKQLKERLKIVPSSDQAAS